MNININTSFKAIIFDMVGVLIFEKEDYKKDLDIEQVEQEFNHIDDNLLVSDLKSKYQYSDEKINEIMKKIPSKYGKFDDLFNLLSKLKEKYKLAVINNGTAMTITYFKERFEFNKYFDIFVNSTEVGIRKPDPKIYLLSANKLGVLPSECIYIDDVIENVKVASSLGMISIYWNSKLPKVENLKRLLQIVNLS
ncbi:MAG: HAD-IA family hydrolase [bacterium]